MIATLRYVLLTATRDRLFGALFGLVFAALLIALLMADTALAEGRELSQAYGGAAVRLIIVVGLVVFVSFHVRRLYDSREIETILARPISRERFVLGYAGGFSLVAAALVLPSVALLWLILGPPLSGLLPWAGSLLLESVLVVALTLFAALTLQSAVSATLTALGFYVLARLMTFFSDIAQHGIGVSGDFGALDPLVQVFVIVLGVLMPRLDLFSQTNWLVYGADSVVPFVAALVQAAIYVPLLLLAAMFDLRSKRF